jgi:hypothetical protein
VHLDEVRDATTVKHWFASARHDSAPVETQQRYLDVLGGYVEHSGKTPDEWIAYCFLRKKDTGERFPSVKRRGEANELIESYVAARGWTGKDAVVNGNIVRGFFIHNGAVIQGRAWRG